MKFFDFVIDVGLRVVGLRFLTVLFFLAILIFTKPTAPSLIFIESIMVFLLTAMVYFWGGWKATKDGFGLMDTAKAAILISVLVALLTSTINQDFDLMMVAANVLIESILGLICMLAGAFTASKVRLK